MLAAISGVLDSSVDLEYLLVLLVLSAASIYLGVRFKRFAFVVYGTLFGYAGLTMRLLDGMSDEIAVLLYFIITGSLVLFSLVRIARRFGRDA